ncbi:hypothetical protein LAZ67_20001288 [Cordylochernes scorpioides]|uniref:DDE-1 domain-containing protein n=1 Tax=Cordylochernes scorpioides TaxID=51811 RepID=A0ABY6LP16_9ARAC|nr:hypothetical protein LAZ67_20001288 [Cordylochernes scorpioides]
MIDKESYNKINVYNAEETGLYWKKMPKKSLVAKNEMSAPGYKTSKSRITAMVYGNINGTHRLPLLTIRKFTNPRKELQRTVLMEGNYEKGVQQLYKEIDLKKAVYMAAKAWATLKDTTLAKSWNKLLPSGGSITASEELPNSKFVSELAELITKSSVFEECDQKDIQNWLECDVDDPGYQLLTIIESFVDDQGSSDNEEELRDDIG